ncbi:MAG TPA: hypothetical protein VFO95_18065 [Gemmatimonadales bacterium]|nr:hypothetical protein [Gemmatimonadales bacterium]
MLFKTLLLAGLVTTAGATSTPVEAPIVSKPFAGVKANTGKVMAEKVNGRIVLTLTSDFQNPDAPDPHWQVIDSKGNVYLLHKLSLKDGKMNRSITLPAYIQDVAKVRMWCAFVEVNLGEAEFETAVK